MKEMMNFKLVRENSSVPWGFRLGGGVDRGRVFSVEKIGFMSLAMEAGLHQRDYLCKVNGKSVLDLKHDECKALIQHAGLSLELEIERGDHIVPSLMEAFPKKQPAEGLADEGDSGEGKKSRSYFMKSIEDGKGVRGQGKGFTTVGKPKMAQKQYNSPLQMYSEEAIDEIMRDGTLNGKPFDLNNMMNPTGKEFDSGDSAVASLLQEMEGERKL